MTDQDPLSEENLPIINFIQMGRLYDVGMAILTKMDKEAANDLMHLHSEGSLIGFSPSFNGQFLSDIMNAEAYANADESDYENDDDAGPDVTPNED